jgi:hypothetical protein
MDGIRIWVYGRDHLPPHVHVVHGDDTALLEIATGKVLAGSIRSKTLKQVREWLSKATNKKLATDIFFTLNPHLKSRHRNKRLSKK